MRSRDTTLREYHRIAWYAPVQTGSGVWPLFRGLLPCGHLLAGLLLVVGCSDRQSSGGGFTPPPMPVEVASVGIGTVVDRFTAVGNIEAGEAITVTSEIDGIVVDLPFDEGGAIARGGLLARLDDRQVEAEVTRAEALRDQRQSAFLRTQSIVRQNAGAPQDLDDATAALKIAEADLALARVRLAKTRITAPFAGVLGARRVSSGTFLRAGTGITDLAQIDRLRVTFSAPERLFGQLVVGSEVTVTTTAYDGYELRGTIDVIEPQLDPGTRSAGIVARLDNPEGRFRPGMSATIEVVLSERPDAMTVPSEAVFVEGGQTFVYAIKSDSTVSRTVVELGTRTAEAVEVRAGLQPGQQIVRAGHQKLYEGAKVMPVSSQDEES
ncbi:MAG: efflux RND transporter periplasmic adaptor subunit [bacterium]